MNVIEINKSYQNIRRISTDIRRNHSDLKQRNIFMKFKHLKFSNSTRFITN